MKRTLFGFLMIWFAVGALAGPIEDGHERLVTGDLIGATQIWEQALETQRGSATLHYNLGTAWYRQDDLPRAIAHWRMGRILSPRDANMVHNLAVARSELTDIVEPLESQPPLLQIATAGEWQWMGCILLFLASLGLWWPRARQRFGGGPALGFAVVGMLLFFVGVAGHSKLAQFPGGVVRADGAFLRAMATRHADVLSELSGGTEVLVESRHGDFVLVHTSTEMRGWIPTDAVFFVGSEWNKHP